MTCGIYVIRRVDSDECYVGQSIDIERRWKEHLKLLRGGKHKRASRMQNVFTKYGESILKFEILEGGLDPTDKHGLTAAEQRWIDRLAPCYNTAPAAGSIAGIRHSEEVRLANSARRKKYFEDNPQARVIFAEAQKKRLEDPVERAKLGAYWRGKPSPWKGKTHSAETRAKMSAARRAGMLGKPFPLKGRKFSEERKLQMSLDRKGKPSGFKGKKSPFKGVPRTPEVRAKIAQSHRNRPARVYTEEQRQKLIAAAKLGAAKRWGLSTEVQGT